MIIIYYTGGSLVLSIYGESSIEVLFACTALMGFGMASIFATGLDFFILILLEDMRTKILVVNISGCTQLIILTNTWMF